MVWREPPLLPPAVPSHVLPIRVRETYNYSFERDRGRVCAVVHTRDRNLDFSFDLFFSLVSSRSYDFIPIDLANSFFFWNYFWIKFLNPFIVWLYGKNTIPILEKRFDSREIMISKLRCSRNILQLIGCESSSRYFLVFIVRLRIIETFWSMISARCMAWDTWYRQDIKSRFPTGDVARRVPGIIELRWLYIIRTTVIIRNVETEPLISRYTLRWHNRSSHINWNRLELARLELSVWK